MGEAKRREELENAEHIEKEIAKASEAGAVVRKVGVIIVDGQPYVNMENVADEIEAVRILQFGIDAIFHRMKKQAEHSMRRLVDLPPGFKLPSN